MYFHHFQKRNYFPKDLPMFAALDLVTEKQFEAMVKVADFNLRTNDEHNNVIIFTRINYALIFDFIISVKRCDL